MAGFKKHSKFIQIGDGGQYANVYDAIANYETNLRFISDVDDSGGLLNWTMSEDVFIDLGNYTWTLGNFTNQKPTGRLIFKNGEIDFAVTSSNMLLNIDDLQCFNITFNNNSTVSSTRVAEKGNFENCTFNLPAAHSFGGLVNFNGVTRNCTFNGTINSYAVSGASGDYSVHYNLTLNNTAFGVFQFGDIYGLKLDGTLSTQIIWANVVTDVIDLGSTDARVAPYYGYNINCKLVFNNVVEMVNCFDDSGQVTTLGKDDMLIRNCTFTPSSNVQSDNLLMENCQLNSSFTIGANNITISNCKIGDTTSGTKTITVNIFTNTCITGCQTEAEIVDNGTKTYLSNNTLF